MATYLIKPNKDTKWLTLEVCKEFLSKECTKSDSECKFAHPPPHIDIQNGKVICCFDYIKSKCTRSNPPCKYLHPPTHLKEQLLEMGRQNLIMKNLQLQSALNSGLIQPLVSVSSSPSLTPLSNISYAPQPCPSKQILTPYPNLILPSSQPVDLKYQKAASSYILQAPPIPQYQFINPAPSNISTNGYVQFIQPSNQLTSFIPVGVVNGASANSYPIQIIRYQNPVYAPLNSDYTIKPSGHSLPAAYPITPQYSLATPYTLSPHQSFSNPQVLTTIPQQKETKINSMNQNTEETLENSNSFQASNNRKRTNPNNLGYMTVAKRPAIVDSKSGAPLYTSLPPQTPYIPLAVSPQTSSIHRI